MMLQHRMRPLVWLLAFILLVSAIFIEALHAPTIDDSVILNLDKIVHALVFGLLSFLLLKSLHKFSFANGRIILFGVGLVVILLGVMDEWVQSMVPGRTASPMDVLADGVGVALVLMMNKINH